MNKKAQITIFVIFGILFVAMIFLVVSLKNEKRPEVGGKSESNLRSIFESCLEEQVNKTIKTLTSQGGYLNNTLNISFRFNGSKEVQNISYLCYTIKEYTSCINQEPMLITHLTEEMEKDISSQVRVCFDEVAKNLENQGEVVDAVYNGFDVILAPRKIIVTVDGVITSTKSEKTTTQRDITGEFQSRLFEISRVVQEINNQEASYCNFELLGFMLFYPEFEIDRTMTRDSTIIYSVKHNKGIEKFVFAVRSCSFPPAF